MVRGNMEIIRKKGKNEKKFWGRKIVLSIPFFL